MLGRKRKSRRDDFERNALPHLNTLYGVAHRLTRNARDAEDLVQDALLRAYRFWDTFQAHSNCKAWLCRILTNTFINNYQKRRRGREVLSAAVAEQSVTDGILMQEKSLAQKDPESVLVDSAFSDHVLAALDSLPAEFRTAVVLCDVESLSYKEIAEIMECPVGTVMSRLHRGRKLLKKTLHAYAHSHGFTREQPELDNVIQLSQTRDRS